MLSQALEVFKKEYKENKSDKFILDSYIPADGTYVVVENNAEGFIISDKFDIKFDKKNNNVNRTVSKYYDFICLADYYSKLTDMDKAIVTKSGKVIQSNNYLSFIVKKESLTKKKLTEEIIDKYYSLLQEPRLKYKRPKALALYEEIEGKLGEVDKVRLNQIKLWIKENLYEEFKEEIGKEYLKIFFKYSEEDYKKESERYLIPNVYNKNDYNETIDTVLYGLPNNNMSLNSKKPYLKNKTRKNYTPYLISLKESVLQQKFIDYLMNQAIVGKVNIYIDKTIECFKDNNNNKFRGMFIRIKKGKEVEILDYDIITDFNPIMDKEFEYKNILNINQDNLKGKYGVFKSLKGMENSINEVMFSKYMKTNYFTDPGDISINDGVLKSNLIMCRTSLFNWFYKGNSKNIWTVLKKASLGLVKGSIRKGYTIKAIDQFNLRLSLKEYFEGGEEMADVILSLKDNLRSKISQDKTGSIENDREYFFGVGQLVSYFISRSKSKKKPLSLANPFINSKSDRVIKDKLQALYRKYNYDIQDYDLRFKNLYSMVTSYEVDDKIDVDMIIAGYLHSNLIYEKKQEN